MTSLSYGRSLFLKLVADFQILSLDGGGIKGAFTAALLARLEENLKTRIVDHFDLIVGTSTGGIIAIGLGLGLSPAEMLHFYEKHGPVIFRRYLGVRWWKSWFLSKYPQRVLRKALQEENAFGDRLFGESQKRLVIPSYSLTKDQPYLFRTPHCKHLKEDRKIEAWKVALATSAAPTFFPVCGHIDGIRHVDGGIWANNPTMVGIIEAHTFLGAPLDKISVLNICPLTDVRARPRRLTKGGIIPWALKGDIADIFMKAQSQGIYNQSGNLIGFDNVMRLDPNVQGHVFSLDKANNLNEIVAIAKETARHATPEVESRFTRHSADPYIPEE
jgi:uncharacterized protein